MLDFNLRSLRKENPEKREQPTEDVADARHRSMMEAIAPYAKAAEQKNVTPVYINYKTRKTKPTSRTFSRMPIFHNQPIVDSVLLHRLRIAKRKKI